MATWRAGGTRTPYLPAREHIYRFSFLHWGATAGEMLVYILLNDLLASFLRDGL